MFATGADKGKIDWEAYADRRNWVFLPKTTRLFQHTFAENLFSQVVEAASQWRKADKCFKTNCWKFVFMKIVRQKPFKF